MTGGTGYIGQALVRPGSETKLPSRAWPVVGNALDASTFASAIPPGATLVHLVGTPHPSPAKAAEFRRVDLASIRATTLAAERAGARHLVYVSVAHPAPVMQAYIAAREEGEALVEASGIPATILRPWYVFRTGSPLAVSFGTPVRRAAVVTRDPRGCGAPWSVTRRAMIAALVRAVETPPARGLRIVDVPEIRRTRA